MAYINANKIFSLTSCLITESKFCRYDFLDTPKPRWTYFKRRKEVFLFMHICITTIKRTILDSKKVERTPFIRVPKIICALNKHIKEFLTPSGLVILASCQP